MLKPKKKKKSLIIIHTGDGKGKTTAALGLAMRTIAHGGRVAFVQFLKNPKDYKYAVHKLEKENENLDVFTMGAGFTWETKDKAKDIKLAHETWQKAKELIFSKKYNMVVLDEINYAIHYDFLPEEEVINLLMEKPKELHLVLTGRNATKKIIEKADLVTEMKNIKHPYKEQGISAQKGIEW